MTRDFVSCILPTKDRPGFVAQALRCWERQTFRDRELIVVDDGVPGPVADLCAGRDAVTYLHVPPTLLGTKLNIGIERARGDVIQKWDDDDYYAPDFLSCALRALRGCPVARGFVLWEEYLVFLSWRGTVHYTGLGHKAGPSLCFDKAIWEESPFREIPHAVDSFFIGDHPDYVPVRGAEMLMLVRHKRNTWKEYWGTDVDGYIEEHLVQYDRPLSVFMAPEDVVFYQSLTKSVQDWLVSGDLSS